MDSQEHLGAVTAVPQHDSTLRLTASQAFKLLCRCGLRAPAMEPSTTGHTSMTLTSSQLEQGAAVYGQQDGLPQTMVRCWPLRP